MIDDGVWHMIDGEEGRDVMGDVLDRIREAGIIGAGGAGFPTHVKFSRPCEYIVLNGSCGSAGRFLEEDAGFLIALLRCLILFL